MSTLPPEWSAEVRLQVVAESLIGTSLSESIVLDRTVPAMDLVDRRMVVAFQPELSGIGGSLTEVLSGVSDWVPVLLIDDESINGQPFAAGGRGTDLFGDPNGAPEL